MIGAKIKHFRELKGLTQGELSKAIGHSSAAFISFVEKEERNLTVRQLVKIAEVLGAPIEEFFKEEKYLDTKIIDLKAGQVVKIAGIPVSLLGAAKVLTHKNNYGLIKEDLI